MLDQINRSERALFPRAVSEYVPTEHVARFYVQIAERLDLSALEAQYSDHMGRKGYPPAMFFTLWLYAYMTGVNSSRKLEQATRENVVFMYIAGGASSRPQHLGAVSQAPWRGLSEGGV